MATDCDTWALSAVDDQGGVPAEDLADAGFDLVIAGVCGLVGCRDGVDVVSVHQFGQWQVVVSGLGEEAPHDLLGAFVALFGDECVEGIAPFLGFFWVPVGAESGESVVDWAFS